MGKKGVSATDLKPFSIDDPFGHGHRDRDRRFDRSNRFRKAPLQVRGAAVSSTSPFDVARKATALAKTAHQGGSSTRAKKKSVGCLSTLLIFGVLTASVNVVFPFAKRVYEQMELRHNGTDGVGQVVSINPTKMTLNNERLHEVGVRVVLPGEEPFHAVVKQGFKREQALKLEPNSWVSLRYDPQDPEKIVIIRAGVKPPKDNAPSSLPPAAPPSHSLPERSARTKKGNRPLSDEPRFPTKDILSEVPSTKATSTDKSEQRSFDVCTIARSCCEKIQAQVGGKVESCQPYKIINGQDRHCAQSLPALRKVARALSIPCPQ